MKNKRRALFTALLPTIFFLATGYPQSLSAAGTGRRPEWRTDINLGGSLNYLGAALDTTVTYRMPLSQDRGTLWKTTHLDLGIFNELSPAYELLALYIQVEPIAVFDITAVIGGRYQYDLLGYGLIRQPGYDAPFTAGGSRTDGAFFYARLVPRLKIKLGPVMAAYSAAVHYLNSGNGFYFFDCAANTNTRDGDWFTIHEAVLLYEMTPGIPLGAYYSHLAHPAAAYTSNRICLLLAGEHTVQTGMTLYGLMTAGPYIHDRTYGGTWRIYAAAQIGVTLTITDGELPSRQPPPMDH